MADDWNRQLLLLAREHLEQALRSTIAAGETLTTALIAEAQDSLETCLATIARQPS